MSAPANVAVIKVPASLVAWMISPSMTLLSNPNPNL